MLSKAFFHFIVKKCLHFSIQNIEKIKIWKNKNKNIRININKDYTSPNKN